MIICYREDGALTVTTTIPDTITEWIGNTVCTHESDGVGVTEMTGVTAFKPFFVSLTLPYSAIRGEVLPIVVTVFNYLSDCITVSDSFLIHVSVFSHKYLFLWHISQSF
jgi:alpha-2-macroglobulin